MGKLISYTKFWFEQAMTVPDVNSRLVFLCHGFAVAFGLVFLTVCFVFAKDPTAYPYMVGALGGSAAFGAAGRWMTKKTEGPVMTNPKEVKPGDEKFS